MKGKIESDGRSLSWIDANGTHLDVRNRANGARSRKPRPRPKVLALDPDSDESDDSDRENCWSKLVEQTRHVLNRLMMQTFRSVPRPRGVGISVRRFGGWMHFHKESQSALCDIECWRLKITPSGCDW